MNKFKKILLCGVMATAFLFPASVGAVQVDQQLINGLPRAYSSNEFIIAHESGNPNNTGPNSLYNEVAYMSRNWQVAYTTHWVGSGGKVIQVAPSGYASWGAGYKANYRSYAQVELARTSNRSTFDKDYKSYIELLRQLADEAKVPKALDSAGKGVKSHRWVSDNLGGTNHRDPFSYLASWGVSEAQFRKDIANGLTSPQKPQETQERGRMNVTGPMVVKNSASLSATTVATYSKGDSFNYDKTITKDGVKWYSYISYSRVRRYVTNYIAPKPAPKPPANIKWHKEIGTLYPNTTINIRSGASTSSAIVGSYKQGESVIYDSYAVSGGYVWVHYTSWGGSDRYMAIRTSNNGVNGPIWGYIR